MLKRALPALAAIALALPGCTTVPTRPTGPRPETVAFEGALTNKFVRAEKASEPVARLVVSTRAPAEADRAPVNVALVVDTSGSMEGKAIADAKVASEAMLDKLAAGDRVAVVAFHSKAELLLPSTEIDDGDRREVKHKLSEMRAEGTTDLAAGLRMGLDQVTGNLVPNGVNRVVLLGDGVPNDATNVRDIAREAAGRGITITTLGLGDDYDETLMGDVALLSGGRFRYVDDSAKVAAFFQEEVLRLHGVYAKTATIELLPGPGVSIRSVAGLPTTRQGQKVMIGLGDLSRDDKREVVIRLDAEGRRAGAPVELMDAVLRYHDPQSGTQVERRVFLGARSTSSDEELEAGRNKAVEDAAATVEAAATTVQAIEHARNGNVSGAQQALAQAADRAESQGRSNGNDALAAKGRRMRDLGKSLDAMAPSPSPASPSPGGAAPPKPKKLPATVRSAHDEAMQDLM